LPNFSKKSSSNSSIRCARPFMCLAPLLPMFLPSVLAFAQVAGSVHDTPHRQIKSSIDDRVKPLTMALELSEAQQSAVKKILEQRQQQAWRIRRDPSIPGSARIDKFRALQDSTVEQIRAVLNEEQRKKYDPFAARKIQPAPQQRSVEDWLEATRPH
jgi:hypothetical protein